MVLRIKVRSLWTAQTAATTVGMEERRSKRNPRYLWCIYWKVQRGRYSRTKQYTYGITNTRSESKEDKGVAALGSKDGSS